MLLKQSKPISTIVQLHGVNCEGVSQSVRTDIVHSAGFTIHQFPQSSFFSTLFYDLPAAVAIYAEDEHFAFSSDWTATLEVIPQYP